MIEVRVRPFGAFRDYSAQEPIAVRLPVGASLDQLRAALCLRLDELRPDLNGEALVRASAFASEAQAVLNATDRLEADCLLLALPPVCGG